MKSMHHTFIACLSLGFFLLLQAELSAQCETIMTEDFESGSLAGKWIPFHEFGSWETSGFERRPEFVHSGKISFRLTATDRGGEENGSNIFYYFMPGEDKCHFRWYAKFAGDFDQGNLMHWVLFGGNRIDNQWSVFGKPDVAGKRPDGTDFFVTNLDTWRGWGKFPPPGRLCFYSYFPEMKIDKDGHYWGNMFAPEEPFVPERGRWYCYEVMIKLNTPGEHDGEQVFWVDGKEMFRQTGIRWRDTLDLKLNMLMLEVYVHQSKKDNTCWFDDIVISREYIGPLKDK